MPPPTTGTLFSPTIPAAPPGLQNVVPQTDAAQPASRDSFYMPPATDTLAGATRGDGVTTKTDPVTGAISVIGLPGTGGGDTSASGDLYVCVEPQPDPSDGTGTQYILPAPILAGTVGFGYMGGVLLDPIGSTPDYSVQGTQFTLAFQRPGGSKLRYYYIQGTPNSETDGGGSATPSPVSIVRGVNVATSPGSSCTITLPAGTQAGDLALLFIAAGLGPGAPGGWTQLSERTSGNPTAVWSKVLTSADILTGSVACSPGSSSPLSVGIVTFIGATAGVREVNQAAAGSSSIFGTNPTTTSSSVVSTDIAITWAGTLSPSGVTISVSPGSTIGSINNSNGAALIANAAMAGGATTFTFVVSGTMTGGDEYVVIVKGS